MPEQEIYITDIEKAYKGELTPALFAERETDKHAELALRAATGWSEVREGWAQWRYSAPRT